MRATCAVELILLRLSTRPHYRHRGARPAGKQARKHVRDARDFNNIETRAVIKSFTPARQGTEGNSLHS